MSVKTVDSPTLKRWIEVGEAVIVDVREPGEHAVEHIEGAHLVPLGTLTKEALPNCTGKKVVVHCALGKRGSKACEKLLAEFPGLEVYNLEGGIASWKAAGYDIKRSAACSIPIHGQVQVILGSLLMICSLLGYIFSPVWFFFTGLIGFGLALSGLTGRCGLALLLAKMPWNEGKGCGGSSSGSCHIPKT
jgi:rhodanese-related sulfurtransferase